MKKKAKAFVLGLVLGLLREFFVVQYFVAVRDTMAVYGTGLTLGIGIFDLVVVAKMSWNRDLWMAAGYVLGESIGTFVSINLGRG